MMNEHPIDDLPAYALGCLTKSESQTVGQHLAICAGCRSEVAALRDAAAQLTLSAEQAVPPPRVKQAVLSRVEADRKPARNKRNKGWWNLQSGWGVAALAVIILLLVSNLVLLNQVWELSRPAPAAGFQLVSMAGAGPAESARGVMIVTGSGRFGTLVVDGLPELDEQQQYQLWLIEDGERTSGGVFSVDYWGYGAMVIKAPLPLNTYSDFGVTIEPAGGSPSPTGDKVLGGSF